jgi:4-amino-4-deoxy-L-arabinose transferase-like glycosyltransferase
VNQIKHWLLLTFIGKILLCLVVPLSMDEYYYFLWGNQLSLSYFDHPPMIGWLMWLSQPLAHIHPGAIRWPVAITSQVTLYIWIILAQKSSLSDRQLKYFFWIAILNPLWGLGGIIATPDVPLVFTWSLGMWVVSQLMVREKVGDYFLLGLFLGVGFMSKYQIVLFLPCLFWLIWQQELTRRLWNTKTLVTIAVGLLSCLPVFIWNYNNDWASFAFQWQHGMSGGQWRWQLTADYLLGQIALIFPTLIYLLFKDFHKQRAHWLWPFAIFPFLFFLYSSLKGKVEANWVIMAFPTIYCLAIGQMTPQRQKWAQSALGTWSLALFIVLVGLWYQPNWLKKTRLYEVDRYEQALQVIKDKDLPAPDYTYNYQSASFFSFKENRLICKLPSYGRPDHFDYIKSCGEPQSRFFMLTNKDPLRLPTQYEPFKAGQRTPLTDYFDLVEVKRR